MDLTGMKGAPVQMLTKRSIDYSKCRRISIFGPPGSGKTTTAAILGQLMSLKVVNLDRFFWLPGWRKPGLKQWRGRVKELVSADEWIMEGNYFDTADIRLSRTDLVILLWVPSWVSAIRVARRMVRNVGRVRPEMTLPERINIPLLVKAFRFKHIKKEKFEKLRRDCAAAGIEVVTVDSSIKAYQILKAGKVTPPVRRK